MSDFKNQYALWDEFLTFWPASRLATMALDEYTHAGSKDTFTYWVESRLDQLGSIRGGSSFKFGVFSRKDIDDKKGDVDGIKAFDHMGEAFKWKIAFHYPNPISLCEAQEVAPT